MAGNNEASISEYKCSICLQILVEPVVLPCKHEMCRPCFRKNVEEANFLCPMCRKRMASWARKCIREGTLVDQNRWNLIQKLFPDRCLKRLNGDDDESDDDESYQPPPKRVLAKSGELRQEYQQEMNKILKVQEEEEQASNDLIKNMLEKEQGLQLQQEDQKKADEQLARKLSEEGTPNVALRTKSKDLKRKKINSKSPGRSYTLDKYFQRKDSRNLSTNNNVPDDERLESDYEIAMALQKQFDQEAVAADKRDDYMLRKSAPDQHACTQEKQPRKSGELQIVNTRNGHSNTRKDQNWHTNT